MEILQLVPLRDVPDLLIDNGDEIFVVDLLLLVGNAEETLVRLVHVFLRQPVSQFLKPVAQRVAARTCGQYDARGIQPDILRGDDLEGLTLFQNAVLVDPGAVRKGIGAYDGLVGRHRDSHQPADQAACGIDLVSLHIGVQVEVVAARADRHHDLFKRGVACPLAQTVDGALGLSGPVAQGDQGVRGRHAQVVVAVNADHCLVDVRHPLAEAPDEIAELLRDGIANGVGYVDRCRAGLYGCLNDLAEIPHLGPCGIHRREFHIVAESLGPLHSPHSHLEYLIGALPEHGDVIGRGADEGVQPGLGRSGQRLARPVDVLGQSTGKTADGRPVHLLRDSANGLEVLVGGDRESRLDHVDLQAGQLMGDLQLLSDGERSPRGLLGVAQGRVEHDHVIHTASLVCHSVVFLLAPEWEA